MANKVQIMVADAYRLLITGGNSMQSLFLLIVRLYWGWQFFLTGRGKLINHASTVEFFMSLGIPAPEINAWGVAALECFGGLLLVAGLCTRPIGLLLAGNMLVAYLSVVEDRAALLGIFNDPAPFFAADPFFFLVAAGIALIFGPGRLSLDWLVAKMTRSTLPRAPQNAFSV